MSIIYYFRQDPFSFIEKSLSGNGEYKQVGRGLIFFSEMGINKPRVFRDGTEIDIMLRDCRLVTNTGYAYRISGMDDEGREWFVFLGDGLSYKKITIKKNELFVKREHVVDLFAGRPFKEVLGECCCHFVREQKIGTLRKEKIFAKKARKVLEEALFLITKQKGSQQSRVKVCTMIKKILASR